jgi:5,10-methylenetetrahydrofolate reductase
MKIKNLQRKIAAGADFLLTQPVYQPEQALAFLAQLPGATRKLAVPVLVGCCRCIAPATPLSCTTRCLASVSLRFIQERITQAGGGCPGRGPGRPGAGRADEILGSGGST